MSLTSSAAERDDVAGGGDVNLLYSDGHAEKDGLERKIEMQVNRRAKANHLFGVGVRIDNGFLDHGVETTRRQSARSGLIGLPRAAGCASDVLLDEMGYALYLAQRGEKHVSSKPLKGLGSGVLEVVADHRGDTFRAVYTVRFADSVFVLHAFQKKSKSGAATPKPGIELIKQRLKQAIEISKKKE